MLAAEREARRWVQLQPRCDVAAVNLVNILEMEGRPAQADSVYDASAPLGRSFAQTIEHRAMHLIPLVD